MSEQTKEPILTACACGARDAAECPGSWEPGCDLGNSAKHVRRVDAETKAQIDNAMVMDEVERLLGTQPVPALRNTRAGQPLDSPHRSGCRFLSKLTQNKACCRYTVLAFAKDKHRNDIGHNKKLPRSTPKEKTAEVGLCSWVFSRPLEDTAFLSLNF